MAWKLTPRQEESLRIETEYRRFLKEINTPMPIETTLAGAIVLRKLIQAGLIEGRLEYLEGPDDDGSYNFEYYAPFDERDKFSQGDLHNLLERAGFINVSVWYDDFEHLGAEFWESNL